MPGSKLEPGDLVVYHDHDQVQWGPWHVVDVADGKARVRVDMKVVCPLNSDVLEKVVDRAGS